MLRDELMQRLRSASEVSVIDLEIGKQQERGSRSRPNSGVFQRHSPQCRAPGGSIARLNEQARALIFGERRQGGVAGDGGVHTHCVGWLARAGECGGIAHPICRRQHRRGSRPREARDGSRWHARRGGGSCDDDLVARRKWAKLVEQLQRLAHIRVGRRFFEIAHDPLRERGTGSIIARRERLDAKRGPFGARPAKGASGASEVAGALACLGIRGRQASASHRTADARQDGRPRGTVLCDAGGAQAQPFRDERETFCGGTVVC